MKLRDYQQAAIDALYHWWMSHPEGSPILVMPTGAGKSVVIAELTRLLFDTWPEEHPRTLVIVPSKELAEQNADKLRRLLPAHLDIGYYSASVGQKRPDADVIVATIGSIAKNAHLLGNIKCVIVDECFVGDTPIFTTSGNRRIADIKIGDAVYTASGIGIVQGKRESKPESIYSVRFSDGTKLRVTGNHPFFTAAGWKNAKELAGGEGVVRIQDMRTLWKSFSSLDERRRDGEGGQYAADETICKSEVLLNLLFKEIRKCNVDSRRKGEDGEHAEAYSAQTIADWWERPWNDTSSVSDAFDFAAWMESGVRNQDRRPEVGANLPALLQSGHREPGIEDCDRTGWRISQREAKDFGREKRRVSGFTWVESVSLEEPGSIEPVFNLQVSGHPSYFANGILVHNCHLISPDGPGQYRAFLRDLAKYCKFRIVGLTATPFRGNGVWLTDGKDPLFTGIAHEVKMQTLMDAGHLAPFVRPVDIATRIDSSGIGISTTTGDYNTGELAKRVSAYLPSAANDACRIAADRKKWLAFTPTVANAEEFAGLLLTHGISTRIVTGETAKKDREEYIAQFHAGEIRCLVTVLALATGFDVPDVDCVLWCRPTISPVLYIQGAGRGLRPSPGKEDCLWLDFSDTTERMGPIDAIRGRKKGKGNPDAQAPFAICNNCGEQVRPASALECPNCGALLREAVEDKKGREASNAAVMLSQLKASKIVTYPVQKVTYDIHKKEGSPDSLRVEYWSGMRIVAREWVCFDHKGFARAKAEAWWAKRIPFHHGTLDTESAFLHLDLIDRDKYGYREPTSVTVNEAGKYPEIVRFDFPPGQ